MMKISVLNVISLAIAADGLYGSFAIVDAGCVNKFLYVF